MVLLFLGGNMINEYNYEVLSREELERNFKLMKDNNIEVRETIILHNIKLVFYRYYKRFSNTNMNMADIVAYGMIGLIKAVILLDQIKNVLLLHMLVNVLIMRYLCILEENLIDMFH